MTQEKTAIEGNRLIAEFMEFRFNPDKRDGAPFYKQRGKDGWVSKSYIRLNYQNNWSDLMPVVKRILKMNGVGDTTYQDYIQSCYQPWTLKEFTMLL